MEAAYLRREEEKVSEFETLNLGIKCQFLCCILSSLGTTRKATCD